MQDSASACVCVCVVGVEDSASLCVCMSVCDVIPAAWVSETGAETLFGITSQDVLLSRRMVGGVGGGRTTPDDGCRAANKKPQRRRHAKEKRAKVQRRPAGEIENSEAEPDQAAPPGFSPECVPFLPGSRVARRSGRTFALKEGLGHLGWHILKSTHL